MRKVIDFEMLKMIKKIQKMSPEQRIDALTSKEMKDDLMNHCPPEELSMIMESEVISGKASDRISKVISKKHGKASDANPVTSQRRGDYYRLCLYVASHIYSRALAMYEPQDRDRLLEEFSQLSYTEAALMRHEVESKYSPDEENSDE